MIARDGLLVVTDTVPHIGHRERIVVPRTVLHGLLTALHLRLAHPTKHQLRQVFGRAFFALDSTDTCDTCTSLK